MKPMFNRTTLYLNYGFSLIHFFQISFPKQCISIALIFLSVFCGKSLQAQVLINPTTITGNFEGAASLAAAGWSVANAATNQWRVGAFSCTGATGAYVGNAAGSNAYTNVNNISYIYRSVTFPAGQTCITLSFNWKGNGEANQDGLLVFVGSPGGPIPLTGWPFTDTDTSAIQLNNAKLAIQTPACANVTYTLPPGCAGTTRYIVFCWLTNNSVVGSAATTLDDINLVAAASVIPGCATSFSPANLATGISPCNPAISWTAPAGTTCTSATSYDIYFGTATNPPLLDNTTNTSYSLPILSSSTVYY